MGSEIDEICVLFIYLTYQRKITVRRSTCQNAGQKISEFLYQQKQKNMKDR